MAKRGGYRGYIGSRRYFGERTAQHVQNLVVRNHAGQNRLPLKLALVEYAMDGCFMMFEQLKDELPTLDGVIFFSMFLLPPDRRRRDRFWTVLQDNEASFHAALEGLAVRTPADIARIEDIWLVRHHMTGASPTPVRVGS